MELSHHGIRKVIFLKTEQSHIKLKISYRSFVKFAQIIWGLFT